MATKEIENAPAALKSAVWQHFGFAVETTNESKRVRKDSVICKHCYVEIKYSGSTTNMQTHLKRHHPNVEVASTPKPGKQTRSTGESQATIKDAFMTKLPSRSLRAETISRAIAMFIAQDMRPYSVVDNPGFRDLMNVLEPKYNIPSRPYFSKTLMPQLYEDLRQKVKTSMNASEFVAITTDGWTSRSVESYITITGHFVDKSWMLKNVVLQTRPIYESHTAANIGEVLLEATKEWNLCRLNGMIPVVTDNASNMDGAVKAAGLGPNIKCFAHTINLATQKGLQVGAVKGVAAKVRRVVTYFHKSSVAAHALKTKQTLLQLPAHKLIMDVPTRWNSSYEMFERYLEQQPAVVASMMSADVWKNVKDLPQLTDSDVSNVEELIKILKPLKVITSILCDEKCPTVSLVFPLQQKIIASVEACDGDTALIRNVKVAIRNDIAARYNDPVIQQFLMASSCLDPRFKHMPQLPDKDRQELYHSIASKAADMSNLQEPGAERPLSSSSVPNLPALPEPPAALEVDVKPKPPQATPCAMQDLLGDVFITGSQPATKTIHDRANDELASYRSDDSIALENNPLMWWKENSYKYPLLSKVAKYYLGTPATSVPSERVFSTAGDIVTAQRAALDPDQVDLLIFMKKNLKI